MLKKKNNNPSLFKCFQNFFGPNFNNIYVSKHQ